MPCESGDYLRIVRQQPLDLRPLIHSAAWLETASLYVSTLRLPFWINCFGILQRSEAVSSQTID